VTSSRPSPVRPRRRALTVLAAVCLLGAAAACASPAPESALPEASGGTAADPTAAPSAMDPDDAMLAWARCMRDHGVDVPDPDHGRVTVDGSGVTPEQLRAAESACQEWQRLAEPEDGGTPLTAEQKQAFLDDAQCMRDRGWNVSDPTFDGGRVEQQFKAGSSAGPGDPAPGDPRFEKDLQECAAEAGLELPGDASTEEE
jgi:hypothetical protein